VDIAPGEPLKLGVIQDLSGGTSAFGVDQLHAIELALARRDDVFLGHPVELLVEDEGCLPEGGINAALNIVTRPQVVAILGTSCSGAAATAAEIMSEAGLVMISGSNTAPSLTSTYGEQGADWQPGYFRTIYSSAEQGQAAAVFAFQELGLTRAATVNDGDPYTSGLTNAFSLMFTKLGGEIVLDGTVNQGDTDMRPILTAVAVSKAELVFFPLHQTENEFFIQQARELTDLDNVVLMSEVMTESMIETVSTAGVGVYFVTPALLEGPIIDELLAEYKSSYGKPPSSYAYVYAYDATNLILDTVETVAVQEKDGTLHIGRQALRDALYATTDYQGVTGVLTCDQFGDCASARFNVVHLDDPAAGVEGLRANVIYTYTPEQ
jgi:branched-chain amino acid transport system substrate-binding protein